MCKVNTMSIDNRSFKVADIKSKYMKNIVEAAKKCDYIIRIILFGSSIDERCTEQSDIDLAIFGIQNRSKVLTSKKFDLFAKQLYLFDECKQSYDLLYFKENSKNEGRIFEEIKKGEILYERKE